MRISDLVITLGLKFLEIDWIFGKSARRQTRWWHQFSFLMAAAAGGDFQRGGPLWLSLESCLSWVDYFLECFFFSIQFESFNYTRDQLLIIDSTCSIAQIHCLVLGQTALGLTYSADYHPNRIHTPLTQHVISMGLLPSGPRA